MRSRIIRFTMLSVAAGLALAAMTACFFGGGEEPTPEPTPDLQATIAAAVTRSVPAATPAPEPTAAPTPDLPATVQAAIAAANAAAIPPTAAPTAVPEPTPDLPATLAAMAAATAAAMPPTPTAAPTAAPEPTSTPPPAPTAAPRPSDGPPCTIAGTVTIDGNTAPENTVVLASSKDPGQASDVQVQTDEEGRYVLAILNYGVVFDLLVEGEDTNKDTPQTTRGCREKIDLSISR